MKLARAIEHRGRRDNGIETGLHGGEVDPAMLSCVLTDAFNEYPLCSWLLQDVPEPADARGFLFASLLDAILSDDVRVDQFPDRAAALWIPSHALPVLTARDGRRYLRRYREKLGLAAARRLLEFEVETSRHHPSGEYDYLFLVGVRTGDQRHGLGSQLLRVGMDRADSSGRDIVLDTSDEGNLRFYGRMGFEVEAAYVVAPGAPRTWLMRRPPAGA